MSVATDVQEFLETQLAAGGATERIGPEDDLLASGVVDSEGLMQLVAFLSERYGVAIPDEELVPENFRTIEAVDAFVERQRREGRC